MYAAAISLIIVSMLSVLLTVADRVIGARLYDSPFYNMLLMLTGIVFNVALIVFVLVVTRRIWALERLAKAVKPSEN